MADWLSILIAGGALIVAVIALVKSASAQREANDLQSRIVRIEERRERDRLNHASCADLRSEVAGSSLCLINKGKAEARNIRLSIESEGEPPALESSVVPLLGPMSAPVDLPLVRKEGADREFILKITWDDDFGKNRTNRTTLTCGPQKRAGTW